MAKDVYSMDADLPLLIVEWTAETSLKPLHWHDCLEIAFCLSGEGQFVFADKRYAVSAGDVLLINNLERHMTQGDPDHPNRYVFVKFDSSLFEGQLEHLLLPFIYEPKRFCNRIEAGRPAALHVGECILRML